MRVEMGVPQREYTEPTKNLITTLEKLYYSTGSITRASKFGEESSEGRMERPFAVRRARAELFHRAKEAPEERTKIIEEAKKRDLIAEQYFTQKTISIEIDGLGTQETRVVDLSLPQETENKNTARKPPIFFIPGISADIECVGSLAMEMVLQGREVIVIGYPEAFNGKTTDTFVDAVAADPEYGPHTQFFNAALAHLLPEGDLEIWGYSTGAPIAAKILENPAWQQRVTRAVFLCPGGSVQQSLPSLAVGLASEIGIMSSGDSAKYVLSTGGKASDAQNLTRRNKITSLLMKRVIKKTTDWSKVHVQEGGQIVFVSGEKDRITKSTRAKTEFQQNPQSANAVIEIPNGTHLTPFTQPKETLEAIASTEKNE